MCDFGIEGHEDWGTVYVREDVEVVGCCPCCCASDLAGC